MAHMELPALHKHGSPSDRHFLGFSNHVLVRNVMRCSCAAIVEGKGGWIMLVVVSPAHTNILLATVTQCCPF